MACEEKAGFDEWLSHMRNRIDTWHQNAPTGDDLTSFERDLVGTFEVTYYTALLRLYQPTSYSTLPPAANADTIVSGAAKIIQLYRRLFLERKLTIYWQATENVISAGTALMFCYVNSLDVRSSMALYKLESLVHTCSSLLWGMAERSPTLGVRRDDFDRTSTKVLDHLNATTGTVISYSSLPGSATSQPEGWNDIGAWFARDAWVSNEDVEPNVDDDR